VPGTPTSTCLGALVPYCVSDVGQHAGLTIGVDIGGTKVLAVLLDGDRVVAETRSPTPTTGVELLEVAASAAASLRSEADIERLSGIGVGAPGLVDGTGTLRYAPNLPGGTGLAIQANLQARFPDVVVRVGNDATCAGWAERVLGAARGSDDVVMVTLGTGIGGGIVAGGRLLVGTNGFAGEIGHMVVDPHGPPCPCGKRGCWERFASGSGLGRLGREAGEAGQAHRVVELAGGDPEAVRGEHVTAAASDGDEEARAVMAQFGWWLALGLANLANTFDPQCLVLGGGLVSAGAVLLDPVRAAFAELVEAAEHRPPIRILAAELGERAGAIGAALLAAE
jgi:glucokinase